MTDPRDGQPHDPFGNPDAGPPTTPPTSPSAESGSGDSWTAPSRSVSGDSWNPPAQSAWPDEQEYVVHSGPYPTAPAPLQNTPTSFQNAPDPFGGPGPGDPVPVPGEQRPSGAKKWILAIAAILVVAIVAAGTYFLFFSSDDDTDTKAGDASTSEQTDGRNGQSDTANPSESSESDSSPSDSSESGSAGSSESGSAGAGAQPTIAGTYSVNGTIQSYSGPQIGHLGGSPKAPGGQAFTSPQTWTIDGCTESTCDLTVTQGGMTFDLKLADGVWTGEAASQVACSATSGTMTPSTIKIEIPEDGGTATRTLSAQCDAPIQEVDALTLTPQ